MRIAELFGIRVPVVQAPMAGVQGSALALAVSNAGGLGSLPAAMLGRDALGRELEAMQRGTTRPWNVNFFCHANPAPDPAADAAWRALLDPYYREFGIAGELQPRAAAREPFHADLLPLLERFRPPVVSFHFGLPEEALLAPLRAWGARIVSSATTVAEARWLEARGVDAIIAQGLEAGGHRGHFLDDDLTRQMGTFTLTPRIVAAVGVPVIAAGGIADAAGVRAALALGAAGVQVGTAFLCCAEATTGPMHRAALAAPDADHTALTNLFTGRPARGIVNRLMRELGPINAAAPAFPSAASALLPLRQAAEARGRTDFTPLWAGQNTAGCRAVPAAELLAGLAPGAAESAQ
ncbi:MAG: nitronate monooxygenase [Pseudomonadales bacterium]|nr:nitronate monooxygenase [Pseudomonadales bacterium]